MLIIMKSMMLLWMSTAQITWCCRIFGSETGECKEQADFLQYMPFCGPILPYTTCVPRAQTLWYNHSVKSKDLFLAQMFKKIVVQRQLYEADVAMQSAGPHSVPLMFILMSSSRCRRVGGSWRDRSAVHREQGLPGRLSELHVLA
ncbi:hypothetical protein DYB28_015766 [Aphanomyces astaci]|uniref:Secreted protein n=1 Tax=Aphanomyces astaci TaxID=112090 RepID=A0A9X8DLZ8_APHAT|nr:hypothetical protein DYB28_015766 [Aphanomyces astaci]